MLFEEFTEGLRNPADNPCWKGYHPVGTKQKGGRTVPNCVPRNEGAGDSTLQVGDPVIITGNVEYQGRTGDVREIGRDGAFVVVDLYNYGPYSFHASDVGYNDYANSDDEDERTQGVAESVNDDDLNDYYSGYYADLLSQIENMSTADQVNTKLGIKRSLENNEIRLVDLKTEIRSLERELKKLSVAEGYIKDPGPLDLSANPTKSQVWARYMSIYDYEGYQGDENSQEMQDLEDYAAQRFGQDMVDDMLSAGYQSYFGRDDNPSKPIDQGTGNYTSLARSAISAADIKKDGKLTKRANANTKQQVADRLGKHPEPNLPEQSVAETDRVGNMPADKFDDAMARLKQLAGAGPLKTVWDPQKRVYKNMPTAVQPKK